MIGFMAKKILNYLFLFVIISLFHIGTLRAQIIEIDDIMQVSCHIDQNTLVLFDIDNTVIELPQILGTPQWFSDFYKKQINVGITHDKAMEAAVKIYIQVNERSEAKPCDCRTPKIIQKLQNKGMIVLALTSRDNGLSHTTVRQLNSVGVNFNIGRFKNFQRKLNQGKRSKVENGIIYAGGKNKGNCLKEFFTVAHWIPAKVVFVDDQLKSVQEVEMSFSETNIAYIGIRYGFLDQKIKAINSKIHEIQLEHFNKTHELLSDKEAEIIVNQKF